MRLNENKSFHATSKKMLNCALYAYANNGTREGIINDVFDHIQNADFEMLSKQALYPVTTKLYVTPEEFKEVSGIIKKGCRNYNISSKYIVETCIILAIKGLHKDGSLYISRNDIDMSNKIQVSIQQPYVKMLKCKIEPKYDKLPPSDLVTMAVKYVLKNKYECIRILQHHVSMTDSDKEFLRELHLKNRDVLKEFDSIICKLLKFHYKEKIQDTSLGVFNWIVDEFIIRYYKLDRNVFFINKVIEKKEEAEENNTIPDPEKDKLAYVQYMHEKKYGDKKEEEKNVTKDEIYGKVNVDTENTTKIENPVTNSSDVIDDDDWIMMKILKLRRQLKHTKLELIIRDKE